MIFNINKKTKKIITATSIIIGTVVGVGFLSMPYVAVKSGFLTTMGYLFVFGALILLINLYFGEIILRTKEDHQLVGYAEKYLGTKGKNIMFVLMAFAILSALLAYMIGVGESLSYIIFGNLEYTTILGALFGFLMSILLRRGVSSLRKYERLGVLLLILMLILIFIFFTKDINYANLTIFNKGYLFLPLGVVLFSLIEFFSLPSVVKVLKKDESLTKKVIIIGSIITILIYALFTFLVVGTSGEGTPQVSTLALGTPFIIIGMITMFTSYLALGTSLEGSFIQDYKNKKKTARFRSAILPIAIFLFLEMFDFFSFINIITIGGIIAGGLIVILVLIIHRKAHTQGNRIPEYEVFLSKSLAILISSLFIIGMIFEIVNFFLK
ncbi:MAG TPA: aromatic amino acid transport family protein [Candidatus Absconditabacterales bacterium]|nr:aromatic amino acid transport family protein [Candidatus Absconditabacterales bacterium]